LTKPFVLYTIVSSEEKLVNCIYFIYDVCRSQPHIPLNNRIDQFYKPTGPEQGELCKNGPAFEKCPRFVAYQNHLKAVGLAK
jgi:hypothetical protein